MTEFTTRLDNNKSYSKKWYLVQVKPNQFKVAQENLVRQNFDVFCPVVEKLQRSRTKFQPKLCLLFPGYLFVSFDPMKPQWRAINSTYGVSKLVSLNSSGPSSVPDELIAELMLRCDSDGRLLLPSTFKLGDEVTVVGGPFTDFVTKIEKVDPDQRLWVLLDVMGRKTRVAISAYNLQDRKPNPRNIL